MLYNAVMDNISRHIFFNLQNIAKHGTLSMFALRLKVYENSFLSRRFEDVAMKRPGNDLLLYLTDILSCFGMESWSRRGTKCPTYPEWKTQALKKCNNHI